MDKNTYSKPDTAFLDAYRSLEDACREFTGGSVADLERDLEARQRPADSSRLRMCRVTRNFLVHDGPGFTSAQPAMTAFVKQVLQEVRTSKGTAKDVMTSASRYGAVKASDTAGSAAEAMLAKKRRDVLVADDDGAFLGVIDGAGLAAAICGRGKAAKAGTVCSGAGIRVVDADTPVGELPACKCVVVRNGKLAGVANAGKEWRE